MRNNIWYELVDVKTGEIYLTEYIYQQRKNKKYINIITILLSFSGILKWKYFQSYTWVLFLLIVIMQLITLISNQLIQSDRELEKIISLKKLYTNYFNKVEELWVRYNHNQISKEESINLFYKYRKKEWENIEELDNSININKVKRILTRAEVLTNNYLNKYN